MLALAASLGVLATGAAAQGAGQETLSGLSRNMQMGIKFYEQGQDTQAMDSFMEVLTQGDPAERSMANEYLNLISRRMNPDQKTPSQPATTRPDRALVEHVGGEPLPANATPQGGKDGGAAAPTAAPAAAGPSSEADKALMKKEIRAKIRALMEAGLKELKANPDVKVLTLANGDPRAVAIPTPALFQSGISFQKDAVKLLDALTKVVFGLGDAQVVILPEGTPVGDAKILDMRRTMGISSHLLSAGVAQSRVSVNLLNTQVDIPRALSDFRGVIVVFLYDKPMNLAVDPVVGDDGGGPPLSLGVYPESLRPDRNEGALIEFSVQDPPAGLASWKFQLLQPTQSSARDLAPIQEVIGGSPVFHQIYWNGRQNYFGSALAAGRYECVLTATDGKNRQRTLHRWVQVLDAAGALPKVLAPAPPPAEVAAGAAKPGLIKEAGVQPAAGPAKPAAVEIAPKTVRKAAHRRPVKAPSKQTPRKKSPAKAAGKAPAAPAAKPSRPSAVDLTLGFNKGTHQLTPGGERNLSKIAQWMGDYPMESVSVTGYAQTAEPDAAALAERRAQMVAGLLINKYQIDPKKITVNSHVSDAETFKVEVTFDKAQ